METFNEWEKADNRRISMNTFGRRHVFCPLINGNCKHNCECYNPASIDPAEERDTPTLYSVYKPYCGNAMFYHKSDV